MARGPAPCFNAVCLSSQADDARQAETFEAGYIIAYNVEPGTESDHR